jgi:hypothetical protein
VPENAPHHVAALRDRVSARAPRAQAIIMLHLACACDPSMHHRITRLLGAIRRHAHVRRRMAPRGDSIVQGATVAAALNGDA